MQNQFGKRIKELRESQKFLQRHIASVLQIDTPMLRKTEHGEKVDPSIDLPTQLPANLAPQTNYVSC